jgi:hypothetical protein
VFLAASQTDCERIKVQMLRYKHSILPNLENHIRSLSDHEYSHIVWFEMSQYQPVQKVDR